MRLTQTHLQYWLAHHTPAGMRALLGQGVNRPPSVHACINSHADWKPRHENTIALLRSQRDRAIRVGATPNLLAYCMELGDHKGWSFNNVPRRSAWARRWARRIASNMGPEHFSEVCRRLAYSESVAQYRAGKPAAAYNAYAPGEVRHTACAHCGVDIEGMADQAGKFPRGEWRDRGNNRTCTKEGQGVHEPAYEKGLLHCQP